MSQAKPVSRRQFTQQDASRAALIAAKIDKNLREMYQGYGSVNQSYGAWGFSLNDSLPNIIAELGKLGWVAVKSSQNDYRGMPSDTLKITPDATLAAEFLAVRLEKAVLKTNSRLNASFKNHPIDFLFNELGIGQGDTELIKALIAAFQAENWTVKQVLIGKGGRSEGQDGLRFS